MPQYLYENDDARLQRIIEEWKQIAADEVDDIGSWRDADKQAAIARLEALHVALEDTVKMLQLGHTVDGPDLRRKIVSSSPFVDAGSTLVFIQEAGEIAYLQGFDDNAFGYLQMRGPVSLPGVQEVQTIIGQLLLKKDELVTPISSRRTWPDPPEIFDSHTTYLVNKIMAKYPDLDAGPVLDICSAVTVWHEDKGARRLPGQAVLKAKLDQAMTVLHAIEADIQDRVVRKDGRQLQSSGEQSTEPPERGRGGNAGQDQQPEGTGDTGGQDQQPEGTQVDLSAYRPASELQRQHGEQFPTYKRFKCFVDRHNVPTHSEGRRLWVHAAKLSEALANEDKQAFDAMDIDQNLADAILEAEKRKQAIRSRKKKGKGK